MIKIILIMLGIFSTMDALMINYGIINIQISKILLVIATVVLFFRKKNKIVLKLTPLMCFYFFSIISCLCVYFYGYNSIINNASLNFMIQIIFFYIPFLMILSNHKDFDLIKYYFLDGLKISIFIQALWGSAQLFLFSFLNLDLNDLVFNKFLHINIIGQWSLLYYSNGSFLIRPSGINWEPAYFGIFMAIGFFIEKNILKRIFYIVILLLSLSRTGIVDLAFCLIYVAFENRKRLINKKIITRVFIVLCVAIIGLNTIQPLKYKVQIFISRFNFANQDIIGDGTGRHIDYYPMSLEIMFEKSNLIQILFGYGPRISGVAFSNDRNIASKLSVDNLRNTPWSVESDIIAIFLGHGIIGISLYLTIIYRNIRRCKSSEYKEFKYINLILLFGGITYGFYQLLFSNIIFIITTASIRNVKKFGENIIDKN